MKQLFLTFFVILCWYQLPVRAQGKITNKHKEKAQTYKSDDNIPRPDADIMKEEEKSMDKELFKEREQHRKQKPIKRGRTKKNIVRVSK